MILTKEFSVIYFLYVFILMLRLITLIFVLNKILFN